MERDAEGSKIKGPPPVKAGPHYQEVAHTTTNFHHSSAKTWRLETKSPKSKKKSATHQIVVLPSRENRKKLHNYVSKKSKVSLDIEFPAFPYEFKSDAFSKDILCLVDKS